jgi:chromosome segregation ATPase
MMVVGLIVLFARNKADDRKLELQMHEMVLEQARKDSDAREKYQDRLMNLQDKVHQQQITILNGRGESDRLREQLDANAESHRKQLDELKAYYETKIKEMDAISAKRHEELNLIKGQVEKLQEQVKVLQSEIEKQNKTIEAQNETIEAEREARKKAERDRDDFRRERDSLKSRVKELEDEVELFKTKINKELESHGTD